jgi:L-malate glycosyltransferase
MAEKIKVLHIIKSLGRGGAEMLLPETLKLHDQAQYEFHYIYFLPWKDQMVVAIQQAGGRVTCFSASNNLLIIMQAWRIKRYITTHKIALVHCHLPWAGFVGRMVFKLMAVPVLYTEHNKQERYHGITRWLNKFTFGWQTRAIAVSDDVAQSIRKNIGDKVPVVPVSNGVNTEFFTRNADAGALLKKQWGLPDQAFVVGIVSVFRFQKRLKEWIDVFAAAAKVNPNLYGVLVGDGPLKAEILAHIEARQLTGRILLPGLQTEVKPWYSMMDVFMMTSIFEGLPIALLEAMSMQCAIVTTNAGGIKEVIRPGIDGIAIEVDAWQQLSEPLLDLEQNIWKRQHLANAARQRVIESFGMQKMVVELQGLYQEVLRKNTQY